MDCLLGLDIGSSAVKVGLFDEAGNVLAIARHVYPTAEPSPGYKEQNPNDWWEAVKTSIRGVLGAVENTSILAIGIAGYISSLTFVETDGKHLRPSIGFQDQRATQELEELAGRFTRTELANSLAIDLPPAPTWPLPRLLWMRRHEPAILDKTHYVLQAKDYINLKLTGVAASDPSSNRGLVNLSTGESVSEVFAQLDIPDLVPPIFQPEQIIGAVTRKAAAETGLPVGTPVIAGWNDLNACVLGSGIVETGQAFNVTGTSEHIGVIINGARDTEHLICAPYLPGKQLLYGVTSSGGGSLQWFSQFSGKSIDDLVMVAAGASGGLLFLPYLEGERSPIWDSQASGVLLGLRTMHGEGDVARAILEGVAFSLRQNLELIEARAALTPDALIVSGGASNLRLWNQIKADALGRNMVTLGNPHAGIQGAAILASVAVKLYRNPETAAKAMTRTATSFPSQPENRRHLDRMYELYREIYPSVQGTLSRLSIETSIHNKRGI